MENIAGDLFDSLPDQCPGCGQWDTPAENGPSRLMVLWIPMLGAYLCLGCKDNWAKWVGTDWAPEIVKSTGLDLRATNKPKCVKNVEALASGETPNYESWTQQSHNVMNPMGCPSPPAS